MNNRYRVLTVAIIIAIVSIGGFATIAGAFLVPNVAIAKKSKHNSDNDNSDNGDTSVPFQSGFKSFGQGQEDGVAAGAAAARAGSPANNHCPGSSSSFSFSPYCLGYGSGYTKGYNEAKDVG